MFNQLVLGGLLITVTIVLQVLFITCAIHFLKRAGSWLVRPPLAVKTIVSLIAVVLWLVFGIGVSTWAWAGVFFLLNAFESIEPAIYFSIVTFTTLGYGDITLDDNWRILASLTAVNGLIIFGLNTAFLVEFIRRLNHSQESTNKNNRLD